MNSREVPNGSSRVEREVLEILERADSAATPIDLVQEKVRRQTSATKSRLSQPAKPLWSMELVRIGAAVILAAAAAVVSDTLHPLAVVFAIASAVAFFSLWVPARPSGIGGSPRWRGQDLHGPSPAPSINFERVWSWSKSKRRPE